MKVLFVTGLGRSGSNLLDLLLDSHSQMRSMGGIRRLPRVYGWKRRSCACGAADLQECPFWSRVNEVLREETGREIPTLELESSDRGTFREDNRILFRAVAEVAQTPYVTDSSKSARRLRGLMAMPDIEVIPVHVHRDPRGYAYSQSKRKRQVVIPAFTYTYRSLRLYTILRKRPHVVIQYERLAQNPEKVLRKLTDLLGLPFEKGMLRWAEKTHHSLGANDVLKKTRGSELRPDTSWQDSLPVHKQLAINGIAWPGRLASSVKAGSWGIDALHRLGWEIG